MACAQGLWQLRACGMLTGVLRGALERAVRLVVLPKRRGPGGDAHHVSKRKTSEELLTFTESTYRFSPESGPFSLCLFTVSSETM